MSAPHGRDALREFYGDVCAVWEAQTHTWNLTPQDWEEDNCITVRDLPGLDGKKLFVHRKIEAPLREALGLCLERCPDYKIETIGCFNPRPTRPTIAKLRNLRKLVDGVTVTWETGLSFHSVAGAIDINSVRNPMRSGASLAEPWWDIPEAFFGAFREVGWTCGVAFGDPMHFQYGALSPASGVRS